MEEFLNKVFYHLLQTSPKEKSVVVLESFMGMRALTEAVTLVTFKSFGCKSVYNVLSNIGPLYSTGMDSGIVIDIGFQQAQILPVVRCRLCLEGLEVSYCGGCVIEKQVNSMLLADNEQNARMLDKMDKKLPENFKADVIEGVKTRCLFVMSKAQKADYLKDEAGVAKMKDKKFLLGNGKAFKDSAPYIQCSFFTRACAMEVVYGDPRNEEPNLAHAVCKSILKVGGCLTNRSSSTSRTDRAQFKTSCSREAPAWFLDLRSDCFKRFKRR